MSKVTTYQDGFTSENSIALIWHIDDIKDALENMQERDWFKKKYGDSVKLTDEECMDILGDVKSNHDASLGVSWDTLEIYIDEFLMSEY
tara:strand:- start:45 stop:311 length:267 start_codon:yes stop_codon:yes gene_type:complete